MILSATGICKSYIEHHVLRDIKFHINEGDKIGLIGPNGSGKTTLLNILAKEDETDSGDIFYGKDLKIGYLVQHPNFDETLSLYETCLSVFEPLIKMELELKELEKRIANDSSEDKSIDGLMEEYGHQLDLFQRLGGYEYPSRVRGMLIGLGFFEMDFTRSVAEFSGGQKSRILLARLLLQEPDLLLLDEPTNHLDLEAVKFLETYLSDYRGSILLISHDRYFIKKICNRIFHLENTKLSVYDMTYDKYRVRREKELEVIQASYENQQKEIARQEEIIARFLNYQGERYIKQAKSRQKMLDRMKKYPAPPTEKKNMVLRFEPVYISGKDVLEIENLSKEFEGQRLFSNINISIYRGERVGLIGDNGVGKTTIFRILNHQLKSTDGYIRLGTSVESAYFDQEQKNLCLENTVADELWDSYPNLTHYEVRSHLASFQFFGDDIFRTVEELSGGERARLSLLKLMLSKSNFLLLDEPTNHLDIESREVLEKACKAYTGTIFFISHDRYFLNQVATRILLLTPNGIEEFKGNYDYYQMKVKEVIETDEKEVVSKTQREKDKKQEKLTRNKMKKEKEKLKNLENQIHVLEKEKEDLMNILSYPESYTNGDKIRNLQIEMEEKGKKLEELYEMWFELQEEIEE